jgi:hypothetical protein
MCFEMSPCDLHLWLLMYAQVFLRYLVASLCNPLFSTHESHEFELIVCENYYSVLLAHVHRFAYYIFRPDAPSRF